MSQKGGEAMGNAAAVHDEGGTGGGNNNAKLCPNVRVPTHKEAKGGALWFLDRAKVDFSLSFEDLMIIVTMFVLVGDDIRVLSFSKEADGSFAVLTSISLILFIIEFLLNIYAKTTIVWDKPSTLISWPFKYDLSFTIQGYTFDFYFWLDFLAVISMFPEVEWIAKPTGLDFSVGDSNIGATAKLGRVARMVRLVRLVKLYKAGAKRLEQKKKENELLELVREGVITLDEFKERMNDDGEKQSKVGAELSDTLTRRVITIVLLMLSVVPILTYMEADQSRITVTRTLQDYNQAHNPWNLEVAISDTRVFFDTKSGDSLGNNDAEYLLYLAVDPAYEELGTMCTNMTGVSVCVNEANLWADKLREEEIIGPMTYSNNDCCLDVDCNTQGPCSVTTRFNRKVVLQDEAFLAIMTTIFVAIMLLTASYQFTSDAERLVLTPIQEMMNLVQQVSDNPSKPIESRSKGGEAQFETLQIENAIRKITDLLRIGFGVAGSEIIRENLSGGNDSIDLMTNPGKRIYSVFGFCMIEEFDHMTDVLGANIMDFINDVAEIVHENVTTWGGQCNKNLGGSFLMTWKVPERYTLGQTNVDVSRIPGIREIADRALIGFVKVVADINRSPTILAYRNRPELNVEHEHTGEKVPYKLRMGFGLHAGWAIEGPVGSLQKVDATYLSPHVNMTARCETASAQWHVQILCTMEFYACLSKKAQDCMRRVDKVAVKGSVQSMDMYTFDTFQDQDMPAKADPAHAREAAETYNPDETTIWQDDPDLVALRRLVADPSEGSDEPSIMELHAKGVEKYLNGDWEAAKDHLKAVDMMVTERIKKFRSKDVPYEQLDIHGDGPSRTLIKFMSHHQWRAPDGWDPKKGRKLTSK